MTFSHTKNNGGIEALLKRIKIPGTVDVGIIDAGEHETGDETVAQIGHQHEFGIGVPERSFIRSTMKEKKKNIINLQEKLLKKISAGEITIEEGLGLVGELVSDLIRQKIVAIRTPKNSDETIAKKGSSNPLIDTGQLKNSITYKVNR